MASAFDDVIILDLGEDAWRCGWSSDSGPEIIITAPDATAFEEVLASIFVTLRADPRKCAVLASEVPGASIAGRKLVATALIRCGVAALWIVASPRLALFNVGRDTACLVEVTPLRIHILLVYCGHEVLDAAVVYPSSAKLDEAVLATVGLADPLLHAELLANVLVVGSGSQSPSVAQELRDGLAAASLFVKGAPASFVSAVERRIAAAPRHRCLRLNCLWSGVSVEGRCMRCGSRDLLEITGAAPQEAPPPLPRVVLGQESHGPFCGSYLAAHLEERGWRAAASSQRGSGEKRGRWARPVGKMTLSASIVANADRTLAAWLGAQLVCNLVSAQAEFLTAAELATLTRPTFTPGQAFTPELGRQAGEASDEQAGSVAGAGAPSPAENCGVSATEATVTAASAASDLLHARCRPLLILDLPGMRAHQRELGAAQAASERVARRVANEAARRVEEEARGWWVQLHDALAEGEWRRGAPHFRQHLVSAASWWAWSHTLVLSQPSRPPRALERHTLVSGSEVTILSRWFRPPRYERRPPPPRDAVVPRAAAAAELETPSPAWAVIARDVAPWVASCVPCPAASA